MFSPSSPAVALVYLIDSTRQTARLVAAHGMGEALPDGAAAPPALVFEAVRSGRPHFGRGCAGLPAPMHAWLGKNPDASYAVLPLATSDQSPEGALLLFASEPPAPIAEAQPAPGHLAHRTAIADLTPRDQLLSSQTVTDAVADLFQHERERDAIAIGEAGIPCGLITRQALFTQLGQLYGNALYRRKPIQEIANTAPLIVDGSLPPDDAARLATARPYQSRYDPLIVTVNGRYHGLIAVFTLLDHLNFGEVLLAQGGLETQQVAARAAGLIEALSVSAVRSSPVPTDPGLDLGAHAAVAEQPRHEIGSMEFEVARDPTNSRLRRRLSILYLQAGRVADAKEQARRAEELLTRRRMDRP